MNARSKRWRAALLISRPSRVSSSPGIVTHAVSADGESDQLCGRGHHAVQPDAHPARRPAFRAVPERHGGRRQRDRLAATSIRAGSGARLVEGAKNPGGQGRAGLLHAGPASRARAHVAHRAVDEQRGRLRLPLDARARVAHEVVGQEEVVPAERGAVDGVVPDDGHRPAIRARHAEHAELGVERLLHAADRDALHLGATGRHPGGRLALLRLSRRLLEPVDDRVPHGAARAGRRRGGEGVEVP